MASSSSKAQGHIAHQLLARAHSPETAAQLFTERVKLKPLYLRPTSPTAEDNRSRRRLHRLRKKEYFLRKRKPKPLSAREKRISGIYKLPKEECKYEIFEGLHGMWVEYMQDILDLDRSNANGPGSGVTITAQLHGSKLASADFHGAEIEVVRSRCVSRVGVKGLVVRDSKFTFVVVTEKDELKSMFPLFPPDMIIPLFSYNLSKLATKSSIFTAIPKEHTIFRFEIPQPTQEKKGDESQEQPKNLVFELHGNQFENRPVDRANKKHKWRNLEYL